MKPYFSHLKPAARICIGILKSRLVVPYYRPDLRTAEVNSIIMRGSNRTLLIAAALILLPLLVFTILQLPGSRSNPILKSPIDHFYIVSIVSFFALMLAAGMGYAGMKLRNMGVTFLSLAYISMTALVMLAWPGHAGLPP